MTPDTKPEPTRVMLDLETLGVRPGSAILAIGAVKFTATSIADDFYEAVSLSSAVAAGLTVDPNTIAWWMHQSDDARDAAFADDARPLRWALERFGRWLGPWPLEIWGNGAAFDNALLAEAYARCGMPQPWSYKQDRCYRTVAARSSVTPPRRMDPGHHALNDAYWQAGHLQLIEAAGRLDECMTAERAEAVGREAAPVDGADQPEPNKGGHQHPFGPPPSRWPRYAVPVDPAAIAPYTRYLVAGPKEVFAESEDGSLQRAAHLTAHLVSVWVEGGHAHWAQLNEQAFFRLDEQQNNASTYATSAL